MPNGLLAPELSFANQSAKNSLKYNSNDPAAKLLFAKKILFRESISITLTPEFFLDQLLCKKMMIEIKLSPTW